MRDAVSKILAEVDARKQHIPVLLFRPKCDGGISMAWERVVQDRGPIDDARGVVGSDI